MDCPTISDLPSSVDAARPRSTDATQINWETCLPSRSPRFHDARPPTRRHSRFILAVRRLKSSPGAAEPYLTPPPRHRQTPAPPAKRSAVPVDEFHFVSGFLNYCRVSFWESFFQQMVERRQPGGNVSFPSGCCSFWYIVKRKKKKKNMLD